MINENKIKEHLKEFIIKGIRNFIIYPFGVNGVNVRNILKDYYDITPVQIIDNNYAQFSTQIDHITSLREKYKTDSYVILTVENKEVNAAMKKELQEFVPNSHIINLMDLKRKEADISNFYVENFLPYTINAKKKNQIAKRNQEKIKVRIVDYSETTWNSIKTICLAFQADEYFDLLIIRSAFSNNNSLSQIEKYGFKSIKCEDYLIEEDQPDIFILNHPYDRKTHIKNCRENCKLIIIASMQLIRYCYDMKSFWHIQQEGFGRFEPDYYLFDSLLYNEIMHSEYASDQFIEMGNAKFDGIYEACKVKKYAREWEKLKNKKVILYTTDHGIKDNYVSYELTFDLYAKTIFRYAKDNQEVGIIFRPHKTFIREMLENNLWSKNDLERIKRYCENSPNIIFDDSISYDNAYSIADGIIADAFCGITCSALPTLKPICLTYRSKEDLPYHEDLVKGYDSAYSNEEIVEFMNKIKNNQDDKLDLRKELCEKYIKHFDGKNGWRIKEFIKEKYMQLYKDI